MTPVGKIKSSRLFPIEAEFVVVCPGCDVGMTLDPHIRIDAKRGRSSTPKSARLLGQQGKLFFRLHVEEKDARAESIPDFLASLADAGKNYAVSGHADSQ